MGQSSATPGEPFVAVACILKDKKGIRHVRIPRRYLGWPILCLGNLYFIWKDSPQIYFEAGCYFVPPVLHFETNESVPGKPPEEEQ